MAKTVLVLGANRGLGLEFAKQYAADGYDVIATCRRPSEATELRRLGVRIEALDTSTASSI
ncbi:MAG: SDR family NAD(P)-dependent oxidoreductase, partial [Casimicrobium sp.]